MSETLRALWFMTLAPRQLGPVRRPVREQILESLDRAGGIEYLQWLAKNYPGPFCSLLGKVLPTTIAGGDSGPVKIVLEQRIVRPEPKLNRITQSRSV
jgi:hypothetical protein